MRKTIPLGQDDPAPIFHVRIDCEGLTPAERDKKISETELKLAGQFPDARWIVSGHDVYVTRL